MTKPPPKPLYRECLCGRNLDNAKNKAPLCFYCPYRKKDKDRQS